MLFPCCTCYHMLNARKRRPQIVIQYFTKHFIVFVYRISSSFVFLFTPWLLFFVFILAVCVCCVSVALTYRFANQFSTFSFFLFISRCRTQHTERFSWHVPHVVFVLVLLLCLSSLCTHFLLLLSCPYFVVFLFRIFCCCCRRWNLSQIIVQ